MPQENGISIFAVLNKRYHHAVMAALSPTATAEQEQLINPYDVARSATI
jgi:hypothetical protein